MSLFRFAMIAAPCTLTLVLVACDSDGDGVSNKEEKALGTDPDNEDSDGDGLSDSDELDAGADPLNADSDGDGLNDGDEVAFGTDPMVLDSDGDSYNDGDEVNEGHDPADDGDRIYKGYWPYNADKDALNDPGFDGKFAVGDQLGRHIAKDQFKDSVDIYDFADSSAPEYIIIDVSAEWCGPCNMLSDWLSSGNDTMGFEAPFGAIREAVDNGDIQWITVLAENNNGAPAGVPELKSWDDKYPNEHIPVLADPNADFVNGIVNVTGFWPSAILVKSDTMKVKAIGGLDDIMAEALTKL